MFLFVLKSILSRFPAPCLNFQEKWRDTCVILKLQGQPKKKQKNKLPVKTGLCHVLSWLFRFVISDICLAQKIFRSGHFSAYTRQIVKICINQKNLLRNTVNMLRFQNDILSFGPALYIYIPGNPKTYFFFSKTALPKLFSNYGFRGLVRSWVSRHIYIYMLYWKFQSVETEPEPRCTCRSSMAKRSCNLKIKDVLGFFIVMGVPQKLDVSWGNIPLHGWFRKFRGYSYFRKPPFPSFPSSIFYRPRCPK